MKKGFTLIELLAVIVILAIILLISIPIITSVMKQAKHDALASSVKMIIKSAEIDYARSSGGNVVEFLIENGGITSNVSGRDLKISGKLPDFGVVIVADDGEVSAAIKEDGVCAYKNGDDFYFENLSDDECYDQVRPFGSTLLSLVKENVKKLDNFRSDIFAPMVVDSNLTGWLAELVDEYSNVTYVRADTLKNIMGDPDLPFDAVVIFLNISGIEYQLMHLVLPSGDSYHENIHNSISITLQPTGHISYESAKELLTRNSRVFHNYPDVYDSFSDFESAVVVDENFNFVLMIGWNNLKNDFEVILNAAN